MALKFLLALIVLLTVIAPPAHPQQTSKPLTKDQLMVLTKAGMETPDLVKLIREHGIDFDLADGYLQALRQAGAQEPVIQALRAARPKPLTKDQVLQLLTGHVPSQRAADLVKQHGIDFLPDDDYFEMLRLAGADDALIAALRTAGEAVTPFEVETLPKAEVYLDGQLLGRTDADGRLTAKPKPGDHVLKVSLAGKKDSEDKITLIAGKPNKFGIDLGDLPGKILIHSTPGAEVFLDDARRGTTDAGGQLAVAEVDTGSHALRVSHEGKTDFKQNVTVSTGQETTIEARLEDVVPPPASQPGLIAIQTSPNAEVYLDDVFAGRVNLSGHLMIENAQPGDHALRVTLAGKANHEQNITVIAGQHLQIAVRLADVGPSANPTPLEKHQIIALLHGGFPSSRMMALVKQRGLKFFPTDADLNDIRAAGGTEELMAVILSTAMRQREQQRH